MGRLFALDHKPLKGLKIDSIIKMLCLLKRKLILHLFCLMNVKWLFEIK